MKKQIIAKVLVAMFAASTFGLGCTKAKDEAPAAPTVAPAPVAAPAPVGPGPSGPAPDAGATGQPGGQ